MKTIKYNNKEYKLPFQVALPEDPTTEEIVKNHDWCFEQFRIQQIFFKSFVKADKKTA